MSPRRRSTKPALSLAVAAPLAARWVARVLAAHDPPLTVAQYLALRAVDAGPGSAADLARHSGASNAAVSQLVSGLAEEGLVERAPHDHDRRRVTLTLTTAGREALASTAAALERELGPLLDDLAPPERDALASLEAVPTGAAPPRRPPPRPPRSRA